MSDWTALGTAIKARLDRNGIELTSADVAEITDVVDLWLRPQLHGYSKPHDIILKVDWYRRRNNALLHANSYLKAKNSEALKRATFMEQQYNRLRKAVGGHLQEIDDIFKGDTDE